MKSLRIASPYIVALMVLSLLPFFTHAATSTPSTASNFKSGGIFDCNYAGAGASSVGTMSATGGVYVPVNDAAVTINTGYLVYKECSLRKLVDAERMSFTSSLLKQAQTAISTGRNGNPQYVVNQRDEKLNASDKTALSYIQGQSLSAVNSAFQSSIQGAIARAYFQATRQKDQDLACPYEGDLNAMITGQSFDLDGFVSLGNPACNPFLVAREAYDQMSAQIAAALDYQQNQWDWGRGFYNLTDNAANPLDEKTLTPASVMQESYQQLLGSPVRQLESANDIGQMVSALFGGVTTQVISSNQGLAGITQSYGGQPSYIDQMVKESQNNLVGAAVNTGLQILNAARQIESNYNQTVTAMANNLIQTIGQVRGTEYQCWVLVVQKTCVAEPSLGMCTGISGNMLQVATSTVYSQTLINAQIAPIATTTLTGLQKSNLALQQIDQIIAGITNTTSVDAQRIALQQLDTLTAQGAIHTATDLTNLQQQQVAVKTSMSSLVEDVALAWGDGTPNTANPYDVNSGWCNVNNPTTISMWDQLWRK